MIILTSLKYSPGGQLASIDSELIDEKNLLHFDLSGEIGASIQRTLDGKKVSATRYLIIDCDLSEEIVASIQRTLDGKSFNNWIFKGQLSGVRQFLTTESPLHFRTEFLVT